jgi:L-fuconate dehydratase
LILHDIIGHKTLADAIAPVKLALGEHVPNRVIFKNYLQVECAGFIQVDAVRVAGVSEFLAVSIMCKKFGVPVIPHLREHFASPVRVEGGVYRTPQEIGASCDLL